MLNIKLPSDPAIQLLGFYPGEVEMYVHIKTWIWMSVHGSIIHNSQNVEATQMFISWWVDEQNVVHPYVEHYLAIKRKRNTYGWISKLLYSVKEDNHKFGSISIYMKCP